MRLKKLARQLLVSSFIGLTSCATGPHLTVYISNPALGGMEYGKKNWISKSGFIEYPMTDKFNCMNPSEFGTLLTYCRLEDKTSSVFASGPKVTVFVSNPEQGGMDYYNPNKDERGFVPYVSTDKYTCLTPEDTTVLLNYCRTKDENSQ